MDRTALLVAQEAVENRLPRTCAQGGRFLLSVLAPMLMVLAACSNGDDEAARSGEVTLEITTVKLGIQLNTRDDFVVKVPPCVSEFDGISLVQHGGAVVWAAASDGKVQVLEFLIGTPPAEMTDAVRLTRPLAQEQAYTLGVYDGPVPLAVVAFEPNMVDMEQVVTGDGERVGTKEYEARQRRQCEDIAVEQ